MFNEENTVEQMVLGTLCGGVILNRVTEKFAHPAGTVSDREYPDEV
jgi:type I restriction enzyme R subunit